MVKFSFYLTVSIDKIAIYQKIIKFFYNISILLAISFHFFLSIIITNKSHNYNF